MSLYPSINNHRAYELYAHLVFVVKYRRRALTAQILNDLNEILLEKSLDLNISIEEFNGERDHVHVLIRYSPDQSIAYIVQQLKGYSSFKLRRLHPVLTHISYNHGLWTDGYYAASCGGVSIETIRRYIEAQDAPT